MTTSIKRQPELVRQWECRQWLGCRVVLTIRDILGDHVYHGQIKSVARLPYSGSIKSVLVLRVTQGPDLGRDLAFSLATIHTIRAEEPDE